MATVTDAARRFRDAFTAAISTAVNDSAVQVVRGFPGPQQADDIVAVMAVDVGQEVATMSTNRTREETITASVTVSVWRKGGPDRQAVAEDRAYDLLTLIEEQVRVTDTTVAGTVRWCFLTAHRMDPAANPDSISEGRLVEIDATFTAKARITS